MVRDWPWSELGISATASRDVIQAAYSKKLAKLDLSTPVSSFSRLSEAREKALFLAAQANRSRAAESSPVGYRAESNWPLSGVTTPVAQREADRTSQLPLSLFSLAARRPRAVKLISYGLLVLFAYGVAYLDPGQEEGDEATETIGSPQDSAFEEVKRERATRLDVIMPELFGPGFDVTDIQRSNPDFVDALRASIGDDAADSDVGNARARLRSAMLEARPGMSRRNLLSASDLYLRWLRAGQAQGGPSCREVFSHSFFNGMPQVKERDLEMEWQFSRILVQEESLGLDPEIHNLPLPPVPDWAMEGAVRRTGLDPVHIEAALLDLAHPDRCRVTIAVMEALLERPEDAPSGLLARL